MNSSENEYHFFWKAKIGQWSLDKFTDGKFIYNCAEQYMMAGKAVLFGDHESAKKILETESPGDQQKLGRLVANFNQEIWDKKARIIVYNGNYYRFTQNISSLLRLLETRGQLVEASPYDKVWGIGLSAKDPKALDRSQWLGKNWLGEVLTILRDELRYNEASPISIEKDWIEEKP